MSVNCFRSTPAKCLFYCLHSDGYVSLTMLDNQTHNDGHVRLTMMDMSDNSHQTRNDGHVTLTVMDMSHSQ